MTKVNISAATFVGAVGLLWGSAALAQSMPANPPPDSMSSSTTNSSQPTKSTTGKDKDASRGAKEQTSEKRTCPKNSDSSNVNCKPRTDGSKSGDSPQQ